MYQAWKLEQNGSFSPHNRHPVIQKTVDDAVQHKSDSNVCFLHSKGSPRASRGAWILLPALMMWSWDYKHFWLKDVLYGPGLIRRALFKTLDHDAISWLLRMSMMCIDEKTSFFDFWAIYELESSFFCGCLWAHAVPHENLCLNANHNLNVACFVSS